MQKIKHNLITGAGSGLGLGIAIRLLSRGENVSVLDLGVSAANADKLDAAAAKGIAQWKKFTVDMRDQAQVKTAVEQAVAHFGAPDLAVNFAGVVHNKTIANMDGADFRRVIDINLNGSFHFAWAVMPHLQSGSRLALCASVAGFTSNYAYSAYGASKFGVVGLARTLRYELVDSGINISCICPPEVETPLVFAERESGDPVALAIKEVGGCLKPDFACDKILKGLDAGKWLIVPGVQAKALVLASRFLPEVFNAYIGGLVRKHRRRLQPVSARA